MLAKRHVGSENEIGHFSLENVVLITHKQNIICSKSCLDGTTHEQTIIICRQFFAGHVVGFQPMERKKKVHGMIKPFNLQWLYIQVGTTYALLPVPSC